MNLTGFFLLCGVSQQSQPFASYLQPEVKGNFELTGCVETALGISMLDMGL